MAYAKSPISIDLGQNLSTAPGLPAVGYVRQSKMLAILPFSPGTLWRMVKAGSFPAPVKLSPRVTAWRVEDVQAWMRSRAALPAGSVHETKGSP